MLISKEEAVLRIREQIARETPERGAGIEERLRIYHRRKAKEEALKAIEEISPTIYPAEPAMDITGEIVCHDITELVGEHIKQAAKAIEEQEGKE